MLNSGHETRGDWWGSYVTPKATWETLEGYPVSLGLLSSRPPASILEKERIHGYLAGLLEGEGYFYYTRYTHGWYPCIYIRMCELKPIRFFSKVMNVGLGSIQRSYVSRTKGLRAILLARIIGPMLTGKRRLAAELFVTRGYRVLTQQTLDEYALIYRNPYRKCRMSPYSPAFE